MALLLLVVLGARGLSLGAYPLMDPSEGRYAELAREMLVLGDWVVPRFAPDEPFLGKPPLSFWLKAWSYRAFGVGEFGARLPSFASALVAVALLGLLAARLGGAAVGLGAALVLASTGLFLVLAGTVLTDSLLAACVTLSCVAFPLALESRGARRLAWGLAFFAGLGLAVLAKGLVGPALVAVPVAGWTALGGRARLARVRRALPWGRGILLALAVAVPWHVAAELRMPGFLEHYLIGEHVQRFVEPGWEGAAGGKPAHAEPRGIIWVLGVVGTLPWLPVLLVALRARRAQAGREDGVAKPGWGAAGAGRLAPPGTTRAGASSEPDHAAAAAWQAYLWLWLLSPMLLFTAAGNVMLAYVLPGLPGMAVLTALAVRDARAAAGPTPRWLGDRSLAATAVSMPAVAVAALLFVLPPMGEERSQRELAMAFLAHAPPDAVLHYVEDLPRTAEFYTGGRVTRIDPTGDAIRPLLRDDERQYFAIEPDHLEALRDDTEIERTELLGRFGDYMLRRERELSRPAS
jgi:4-amino-4-deoxy-L-arabinose transferase-like glycosyltransferase